MQPRDIVAAANSRGDLIVCDSSKNQKSDADLELLIANRQSQASLNETLQVVESALNATPGGRIVRVDQDTRMVVIAVPHGAGDTIRELLGHDFIVDQNARLRL